MTPDQLLDAAHRLITQPRRTHHGLWARAAATLIRQALEARVDDLLRQHAPGAQATPMRTRLLCLQAQLPDRSLAHRLSYTWHRLSTALHHNHYDLPPSSQDLETWLDNTRAGS